MANILNNIKTFGPAGLIAGGILASGGIAGFASYSNNQGDPDQTQKAISATGNGLIYSTGAVAIGATALAAGKLQRTISGKPSIVESLGQKASKFMSSPLTLPKAFSSTTPITKDSLLALAKNPKTIALGGAGLGAYIGSQIDSEHPGRGAVIGGVSGSAAGYGILNAAKGISKWKALSPLTKGAIKTGGIIGGAALLAVGGQALFREHEFDTVDRAERDDWGDYRSRPESTGVKSRLNTINASGDIVFGLHNKR